MSDLIEDILASYRQWHLINWKSLFVKDGAVFWVSETQTGVNHVQDRSRIKCCFWNLTSCNKISPHCQIESTLRTHQQTKKATKWMIRIDVIIELRKVILSSHNSCLWCSCVNHPNCISDLFLVRSNWKTKWLNKTNQANYPELSNKLQHSMLDEER